MTRNADNRTTELLREGLTERGIEWRSGLKGVTFVGDWCFVEYDNGKLAATCEPVLTPEQAIAATLGEKPRDKTEEWLLKACNQATLDYVKALEELVRDMWHEITTCPDYTVPPCMTDDICERVRNLGVEMGGDGDE